LKRQAQRLVGEEVDDEGLVLETVGVQCVDQQLPLTESGERMCAWARGKSNQQTQDDVIPR
jgi:hypothetical protein